MPRKILIRSPEAIFHVTNRSNNKEWFYVSSNEVWDISTEILSLCTERYEVILHAFVLMSNHYHLLLSAPKNNLDAMMRFFQTEVAREIQRRAGRINHIFGTRYKWSCLWNSSAVAYTFKYIIRNPVRAGLVSKVEDYFFSSIHPKGIARAPWSCSISKWTLIPKNPSELFTWLNLPTDKELEVLVTKGLRRTEFKFPQGNDYSSKLKLLEKCYGIPANFERTSPPNS